MQELIHNADDAPAREVEFCLDKRQHAVDGLVGGLAAFQGPALLAYNSAVFTDDDFKSIRVRAARACMGTVSEMKCVRVCVSDVAWRSVAVASDKRVPSLPCPQRIGDSLKKDTSQGTKTGRFGIGFNSGEAGIWACYTLS